MTVLAVPLALLLVSGLLAVASFLEQRRVRVLVRMSVRSRTSPELTEAVLAAELAPILAANGLTR